MEAGAPNPYAPPRAPPEPIARRRAPGEWIKWAYLAATAITCAQNAVEGLVPDSPARLESAIRVAGPAARWALLILALAWVHRAWSSVPAADRGRVTPGSAVGRFFFPIYNAYWYFAVNVLLCRAIDATLARAGHARRAPVGLAIAASVLSFVGSATTRPQIAGPLGLGQAGLVIAPIGRVAWFVYMLVCDRARRAVAPLDARPLAP